MLARLRVRAKAASLERRNDRDFRISGCGAAQQGIRREAHAPALIDRLAEAAIQILASQRTIHA
jgi:hypothetical protein